MNKDDKWLIDANALSEEVDKSKHNNPHPPGMVRVNHRNEHDHFLRMIYDAPTVDAVEVPDKKLLKAIKLLIKQYEKSKNSEYVYNHVAHALYHTWKQVDEGRG